MTGVEHHLNQDTLIGYASGSLTASVALVVACHLEKCSACRRELASAEALGGSLIDALEPKSLSSRARENMLARLDEQSGAAAQRTPVVTAGNFSRGDIPATLSRILGENNLDNLPWKSVAPGIKRLIVPVGEGNAQLLNIAGGMKMPVHSHHGSELTLILRGGYSDILGQFGPGDIADLDGSILHQPVADPEGCICLAGMDAKLRFQGLFARLLQPFINL